MVVLGRAESIETIAWGNWKEFVEKLGGQDAGAKGVERMEVSGWEKAWARKEERRAVRMRDFMIGLMSSYLSLIV